MEVLDANHATISTSRNSHLARHLALAEAAGRPLEMAVAIGASEPVVMAAASGCSYGVDEYSLAGGLSGKAIEIIRCKTAVSRGSGGLRDCGGRPN